MKKVLLSMLLCVCLLAGCTSQLSSTEPEVTPADTIPEATTPIAVTDYSITGMLNVTDLYFAALTDKGWGMTYCEVEPEEATGIIVHVMCPQCNEETFDLVEFAELPEASIGQQTFTWTDSIDCGNWDHHEDSFNSEYKYSIIFTLNG